MPDFADDIIERYDPGFPQWRASVRALCQQNLRGLENGSVTEKDIVEKADELFEKGLL